MLGGWKKREEEKDKNKKRKKKKDENCNCKEKEDENGEKKKNCPLQEKCLTKSLVYKAEVFCKDNNKQLPKKVYFGLTSRTFKERFYEHKTSFNNEKEKSTTLSSYIWKLKKRGLKPEVKWSIHKRAYAFSSGGKKCDLCLTEKMAILFADPHETLNSRDEIMTMCRHRRELMLDKVKPHFLQTIPPSPS